MRKVTVRLSNADHDLLESEADARAGMAVGTLVADIIGDWAYRVRGKQ